MPGWSTSVAMPGTSFPTSPCTRWSAGCILSIRIKTSSETIAELRTFGLQVIIPGHCTGWRAVHALIGAFGEGIVDPLAVGSRQTL